jgi:hypothetical protein
MSDYIDNTPKKENTKESKKTNLGENSTNMNDIKPMDGKYQYQTVRFTEVAFPTLITANADTNTYDVVADTGESPKEGENDEEGSDSDSDDESIDINEIFQGHINIMFVSSLSIVGLFILYRMIQKSR